MPIRKANIGYITNTSIWLNYNHLTKPIVNILENAMFSLLLFMLFGFILRVKTCIGCPDSSDNTWQRLPKYPGGSQQCSLLGLDNNMQWGLDRREIFHFSMISNRWKSLKTRLSARSELSCRWLNLHTCKDTWRLIFGCWSRHRCPNPTPPPGITTNSLLGSRPSAVDTQPIHVRAGHM